jgi:hypothetical protein
MRLVIVLLSLLVAGCGSGGEDAADNHGYGYEFDVQGTTGLQLRYSPVLSASDRFSDVSLYERAFAEVEQCMNVSAPPPFVIVVPIGHFGPRHPNGYMQLGSYYSGPSLILVDPGLRVFRHEVVHYLLDFSTGNLDPAHDSAFFSICVPGTSFTS